MKRPSNLILAFIFAIASAFLAYALSRIFFRIISPPEIEIEEEIKEDYQSQLSTPQPIGFIVVLNKNQTNFTTDKNHQKASGF